MSIKPQIAGSDMYMIRLKYHDYPNTVNNKKMVHDGSVLNSERRKFTALAVGGAAFGIKPSR